MFKCGFVIFGLNGDCYDFFVNDGNGLVDLVIINR